MNPRTLRSLSLALIALSASVSQAEDYTFLNGVNGGGWDASLFSYPNINWLFGRNPVDAPEYTAVVHFGRVGDGAEPPATLSSYMNYGSISLYGLAFDTTRTVNLTGNLIRLGSGATLSAQSGTYTIANPLALAANANGQYAVSFVDIATGGTLTATGTVSGATDLYKYGSGTLVLSGANTYTGETRLWDGTVRLGSDSGVSDNVSLYGGTLDLAGYSPTVHRLYVSTNIGAGSVFDTGATKGAIVLTGDVRADSELAYGKLQADFRLEAGLRAFVTPSSRFGFGRPATLEISGDISGAGTLYKTDLGTLILSGASLYTGGTTVSAGRLVVARPSGAYVTHGTLEVANETAQTLSSVTGSGQFVKSGAGTLTVTGVVDNRDGVRIELGTLEVSPGNLVANRITSLSGGTLQIDSAGFSTFDLDYTGAGRFSKSGAGLLVLAGPLSNTGGLSVVGGTLALGGAGIIDGAVNVGVGANLANLSGGTLRFTGRTVIQGEFATLGGSTTVFDGLVSGAGGFSGFGEVEFNGGYDPGNSPARVTFQSFANLGSGNLLTMELAGTLGGSRTNSTTQYDQLDFMGGARLNGRLEVVQIGGFEASFGDAFDLLDWNEPFTGTFSSINLPMLANGLRWDISRLYVDGSIQAVPEPATLAVLAVGAVGLLRRRKRA